ncbi:MAG: 3-phosphoglycerate dehydrogenase [Clostridia bacterium]
MKELLKLNDISAVVNTVLQDKYTLTDKAENPVGIMLRSFAMHDYNLAPSVVCVGRAGAGVNNIPLDRYASEGVVVFNAPGANANAVKELVITSMLLCGRTIVPAISWAQKLVDGEKTVAQQVEKGKSKFAGTEIMGKTLAVYGLGAIGMKVAEAAIALGMNVVGYDPFLSDAAAAKMNPSIKRVTEIDDLIKDCNFITLHVPLTDSTKEFINTERLAKMKNGVNVINCARGELVNNADVIAAIKTGKVNRYVTDFPTAEVLGVDNLITFPHLGASTEEAEDNCAVMTAEEMLAYIENGNIINSVNYPNVSLEPQGETRMVVLFKECAADAVKAKFAEMKKIINYELKIKKGFGAAVVNMTNAPCENCTESLKAIDSVTRVYFPVK